MIKADQSNEEPINHIEELTRELDALKQSFDVELKERKAIELELRERLKELNCHNQISTIMGNPSLSEQDAINKILEIIPPAFRFPDVAAVSIKINDRLYQTSYFQKTKHSLFQEIKVNNEVIGYVEVCYPENQISEDEQVFLPEESRLLFSIAVKIGNFIEKNEKDADLRLQEEKYRILIISVRNMDLSTSLCL